LKTLLILRHGKAEPYNDNGDKARCLLPRGIHDSKHVGKQIADKYPPVEYVLASNAERAAQTAQLAATAAGFIGTIDFRSALYGASPHTLIEAIRTIPDDVKTALIVGHNPDLEELCADLTGRSIHEFRLVTCGLVHLELSVCWHEAGIGSAAQK
jgi:phosphohistidine phosphatase